MERKCLDLTYRWAALSMADEGRPGLRRRLVSLLDAEASRRTSPAAFAAGMVAASAIVAVLSLVRADRRTVLVEQPIAVAAISPARDLAEAEAFLRAARMRLESGAASGEGDARRLNTLRGELITLQIEAQRLRIQKEAERAHAEAGRADEARARLMRQKAMLEMEMVRLTADRARLEAQLDAAHAKDTRPARQWTDKQRRAVADLMGQMRAVELRIEEMRNLHRRDAEAMRLVP